MNEFVELTQQDHAHLSNPNVPTSILMLAQGIEKNLANFTDGKIEWLEWIEIDHTKTEQLAKETCIWLKREGFVKGRVK